MNPVRAAFQRVWISYVQQAPVLSPAIRFTAKMLWRDDVGWGESPADVCASAVALLPKQQDLDDASVAAALRDNAYQDVARRSTELATDAWLTGDTTAALRWSDLSTLAYWHDAPKSAFDTVLPRAEILLDHGMAAEALAMAALFGFWWSDIEVYDHDPVADAVALSARAMLRLGQPSDALDMLRLRYAGTRFEKGYTALLARHQSTAMGPARAILRVRTSASEIAHHAAQCAVNIREATAQHSALAMEQCDARAIATVVECFAESGLTTAAQRWLLCDRMRIRDIGRVGESRRWQGVWAHYQPVIVDELMRSLNFVGAAQVLSDAAPTRSANAAQQLVSGLLDTRLTPRTRRLPRLRAVTQHGLRMHADRLAVRAASQRSIGRNDAARESFWISAVLYHLAECPEQSRDQLVQYDATL